MAKKASTPRPPQRSIFIGLGCGLLGLLTVCGVLGAVFYLGLRDPATVQRPTPAPPQISVLRLGYSPDKEALFTDLVAKFNAQGLKSDTGQDLRIDPVRLDAEALVKAAVSGDVQAVSPDSSVWLDQIDRQWSQSRPSIATPAASVGQSQSGLVGETRRYATSPVVLAMWEPVAKSMGYPGKAIGWDDLLQRAQSDANFKWSHPSTTSASGLLATLAEFYAGAGKTRGLTEADTQSKAVLDYVSKIEKTVRYYGEGELAVMDRARREGPGFLDAFVVQEQMVVSFNQQQRGNPGRLVAVYPREGTLWVDHPLALLEHPSLTPTQRQTFSRFRDFLLDPGVQQRILQAGYRPADLNVRLDTPDSLISAAYGADPRQPQTALQVPPATVLDAVRTGWLTAKRRTNVILVVDTSGSMQGQKLNNVKDALSEFLRQVPSQEERVGLIEFGTGVKTEIPLAPLSQNRDRLDTTIRGLSASGETALLDAVAVAYRRLQDTGDRERINAIVVMTDGLENRSRTSLAQLVRDLQAGKDKLPVVVFCIGYGNDADLPKLEQISAATGGQTRRGSLETIRELYKILSTYF